jgi:sec-independent protein translocase protein TatA
MNLPSGWELVLIVVVIVLLFGARKLPDTARGLGRSLRIFKSEIRGDEEKNEAASNPPAINPGIAPAPPANPVPPVASDPHAQPYQQPNQPYQQPNQPYQQPNNYPQGGYPPNNTPPAGYPTNTPASESQPRDR